MYQATYYVDKPTGTAADPLAAIGLARLLDDWRMAAEVMADIYIRDAGPYYAIELTRKDSDCPLPVTPDWIDHFVALTMPYIVTAKKRGQEPPGIDSVDYEQAKTQRQNYLQARQQLPKEARGNSAKALMHPAREQVEQMPQPRDWDVVSTINQTSAISVYNELVASWYANRSQFRAIAELLLALFSQTPNDLAAFETGWKKLQKQYSLAGKPEVTAAQMVNPSAGKGQNRAKADKLEGGGSNLDSPWPLELLKWLGMFAGGVPRTVRPPVPGMRTKDRKLYALAPVNITLGTLRRVHEQFKTVLLPAPAVKMDILAALRYTEEFIRQWQAGQMTAAREAAGQKPGDYVSGLYTTFYKDMGSAVATMNVSFIALPDWVPLTDDTQVGEMLREHLAIITSLDEARGDEYDMLRLYRDFLAANTLAPFFEFTTAYSSFLIQQRERGNQRRKIYQFSTNHLERMMTTMAPAYGKILATPGFQHLATAIRHSTVILQNQKARGRTPRFEIRYGLGQELSRHTTSTSDFLKALTEFVQSYQAENARFVERHASLQGARPNITTQDIEDIVCLLDEYRDPKLLCGMLVAYGYARTPFGDKNQPKADGQDGSAESTLDPDEAQAEAQPDEEEESNEV